MTAAAILRRTPTHAIEPLFHERWSPRAFTGEASGFDREKANEALSIPADYRIQVFVAIGRQGDASALPDWARAREEPNDRRPLAELVREGSFGPRSVAPLHPAVAKIERKGP